MGRLFFCGWSDYIVLSNNSYHSFIHINLQMDGIFANERGYKSTRLTGVRYAICLEWFRLIEWPKAVPTYVDFFVQISLFFCRHLHVFIWETFPDLTFNLLTRNFGENSILVDTDILFSLTIPFASFLCFQSVIANAENFMDFFPKLLAKPGKILGGEGLNKLKINVNKSGKSEQNKTRNVLKVNMGQ